MPNSPGPSGAPYKWEVLGVVMIGTLMAALDQSIVNVSLPDMMADFGSPVTDIEWVITGYMLAFATLMPLTAWLREHIGYKRLYVGSLFVFTLGSLLCAMAWNLPSLITARVIQALGGGAITPTGMAMITEVFEPHERGKAIGYWGVGVIVGPAFGPTLGGYLTNVFGWRSIFTVNLPVGILGVLLALALLREDKPSEHAHKHPFDLEGFLFLSTFLVSFLLGLSQGEEKGWSSPFIHTCWGLAFTGFIGFTVVETLTPHGILDIRLLKSPVYSACMLVVSARSLALFGGTFLLPLFLQQIMGFNEIDSGLILLPGSLVIALVMPIAGRLSDRIGPLWPSLVGLAGIAYFMYTYRTLDINTGVWEVVAPTLIRGVAIALLVTPVMVTALNSVPKDQAGMASAMMNLIQQVAGSVGIGVLGAVLSHREVFHQGLAASTWSVLTPPSQAALSSMAGRLHDLGLSHADSLRGAGAVVAGQIFKMTSVAAFEDAFLAGGVIVVIAMFPALLLPSQNIHRARKPESIALSD
jgi:MFS transporter, DHA2 family, multidrug resistance protein